jgi:hypothetical protein
LIDWLFDKCNWLVKNSKEAVPLFACFVLFLSFDRDKAMSLYGIVALLESGDDFCHL